MAVIDLYSPRIAQEGETQRANVAMFQQALQRGSEQLFDYAAKKDYNERAFAQMEAEAEAAREKTSWEREKFWQEQKIDEDKRRDELKYKRWNSALVAAGTMPPDQWSPAVQQELSDALFDMTGVRVPGEQISKQPDVVQRLTSLVLDKEGKITPEGQRFVLEANKPMTDIGKILGDMKMAKERGAPDDGPEMGAYRDALVKQTNLSFGEEQGRMIQHVWETDGPAAARALIAEWLAKGTSKTQLKLTLPGEAERKEVTAARGTLQMIRDARAVYNSMKADNLWTVGPGVETASKLASFLPGLRDPRAKELYAILTKVQSDMLRIAAGLAQTDPEIRRQQGYVMNPQLSPQDFETALDLNEKWAYRNLQNIQSAEEAYKQKQQPIPELEKPPPPTPSERKAATENTSDTGPDDIRKEQDKINKRIKDLERRKKLELKGKPPPGPTSMLSPEQTMFQQYIG